MSVSRLRLSVAIESAALVVVLAALATIVSGARVGLGVFAGGMLAIASFWRLVGDIGGVSSVGAPALRWILASALRFAGLAVMVATLLILDWTHPAALALGFTVLPCALLARGLRQDQAAENE